jgi:hypothetical protein
LKKVLMFIILGMFCFFNVCSYAYENHYYRGDSDLYLVGSINNKYLIQMQLYRDKDNRITGTYFYDSVNELIYLSGTLKNGILNLKEKNSRGQITAVFDGKLVNNQFYSGTWSSHVSQKQFPFRVEQVKLKTYTWIGEWERVSDYYNPAYLSIEKINNGAIKLAISSNSGGCIYDTDGTAVIKGNVAYYKDRTTGSEVTFKNHGNVIEVDYPNELDIGATYSGIYKKGPLKEKVPTLYELGFFDSMSQDQAFRTLVKNSYGSFILCLQRPDYAHDVDDIDKIDNLEAQVITGCVRGLEDEMRAIIVYTKDNRFWASVEGTLKDDGFYSNTVRKTIPETIRKWRGMDDIHSLSDLLIFGSINQEQIFRKLVKDDYDSFLFYLSFPDDEDYKDIDNLKAEIASGHIIGLDHKLGAIVMYANNNQIWAAVSEGKEINYYTNTTMQTIPKTIQNWAKEFGDNIHWVK